MTIELIDQGKDGAGRPRFELHRMKPRSPAHLLASATLVGDEVHMAWWSNIPLDIVELGQLADGLQTIRERTRRTVTAPPPDQSGPPGGGTPGAGRPEIAAGGID